MEVRGSGDSFLGALPAVRKCTLFHCYGNREFSSDQGNICAVVCFDGTWPCASAFLRRVWGSLQQRGIFLFVGLFRDEVQFR